MSSVMGQSSVNRCLMLALLCRDRFNIRLTQLMFTKHSVCVCMCAYRFMYEYEITDWTPTLSLSLLSPWATQWQPKENYYETYMQILIAEPTFLTCFVENFVSNSVHVHPPSVLTVFLKHQQTKL